VAINIASVRPAIAKRGAEKGASESR